MNRGAGKGRHALRLARCVMLLVAVVVWSHSLSAAAGAACTETADLRIKIGSTVLSVPRRYGPNVFWPDGKYVGHAKRICQEPSNPPIEAGHISIKLRTEPHFNLQPTPATSAIWQVQIIVRERPASFSRPQEQHDWAAGTVRDGGADLSTLPRKHGFLADDESSRGFHFYFALPETAESLDATPLIVQCAAEELSLPGGRLNYGRSCSTALYSLTDALVIRYRFYDGRHPIETWSELDASVRSFVRSLIQ